METLIVFPNLKEKGLKSVSAGKSNQIKSKQIKSSGMWTNPIPIPAEQISRAHPRTWDGWWKLYNEGKLPAEFPCCVCGWWFLDSEVTPLARGCLNKKVQQMALNSTLEEIYLCKGCKNTCMSCRSAIPGMQKREFEVCEVCRTSQMESDKNKKQKVTAGSKKGPVPPSRRRH